MKKINILLLISICFLTISCTGYLNVKPANVLSVNSFEDVRALMGAHLKMYRTGQNPNYSQYLQGTQINFFSGENNEYLMAYFYSDDYSVEDYLLPWPGRNNRATFIKCLNWNNTDYSETIWARNYGNIGFYNMILKQLEKHPSKDNDENQRVKAEAKFLRAWSFFYLVEMFSPYHNNSLGLPLNTDPDAVGTYNKNRQTQSANYKFLISELKEIYGYTAKPNDGYNIFYDKNIIAALLAEIYLYKGDSGAKEAGDYDQAIKYAKAAMQSRLSLDVIDRNPKADDQYGMYKNKPYCLIKFFYNIDYLQNVVAIPSWGLYQYASKDLYALFPDNDKRKKLYFKDDNSDKTRAITKFVCDFPYDFYSWDFFTAAEMQLIIAESYARENKEAEAKAALTTFGQSRYDNYKMNTSKSVLDNILDERRKEFCFEYVYRWLDMHRLERPVSRPAIDKFDEQDAKYTLKAGDYRFTLPIPKFAELANNKIPQNPGWGLH